MIKKPRKIIVLGAGILPEEEIKPFLKRKKKVIAVDERYTKNEIIPIPNKETRIFLYADKNYSFLKKLNDNSVDVFSILMPIDLLNKSKEFQIEYFNLLDKKLKVNGRIFFLSEDKALATQIKNFFKKKNYSVNESEKIKKDLIQRSQTIKKGLFHGKIEKLNAFVIVKEKKKS